MEKMTDGTCSILNDTCLEKNIMDCRYCQLHSVVEDYRDRVYRKQEENDGEMVIGEEFVRVFLILSASAQDLRIRTVNGSLRMIFLRIMLFMVLSNGMMQMQDTLLMTEKMDIKIILNGCMNVKLSATYLMIRNYWRCRNDRE